MVLKQKAKRNRTTNSAKTQDERELFKLLLLLL